MRNPGCTLPLIPMNACPSPEDPPVTTAEEKDRKTSSREEGTLRNGRFFPRPDLSSGSGKPKPNAENMNSQNSHEVIVSGIHLELTPSLKTFVHEKAERLFRHEERIIRVRVEIECDRSPSVGRQFRAKGHVEIHGPDLNAIVQSDDCHQAIALVVDKLDRMLQRRHQMHRVKRNHPHPVELNATLPKVVA